VTDTDRQRFVPLFQTLARTFNRKSDPAQCNAYFDALVHVPFAELEHAVGHLQRTARFFPKPVEWLDAVQRTRQPVAHPQPRVVTEAGVTEAAFFCARCEDTGWCPDCGCHVDHLDAGRKCLLHGGRVLPGYDDPRPRSFGPCPCRETNPTWAANHQPRYTEERVRTSG